MSKASDATETPGTRLRYANQAYQLVEKSDAAKSEDIFELAQTFFELGEPKKYFDLSKMLYRKSMAAHDQIRIAESSYCIGNYFYNEANYDSAYYYYTKSEKFLLNIKGRKSTAAFIKNIKADILSFKKDYVQAERLSIEALKVAKQEKYDLVTYNCYITLGNSLAGLENYDKAIEYYQKAIGVSDNLKSDSQYQALRVMPYNYIASVYRKKNDPANTIKIAKQALAFDDFKKSNSAVYCYLVNNLAYGKFKLGDPTALKQFTETLHIADSLKNNPIQITSKTYLGEYHLAHGDTTAANGYLKQAQTQAHRFHIFDDELKILQLLAEANPQEKSYYSNRYIALSDSLQVVERATRDKFARIEFETDEIETERNSLSLKTEYLSLQRWIIAAIAVFSIVIIVLWYVNQSNKAKTRELLLKQEQQKANEDIFQLMLDQHQKIQEGKNIEKQRISLELHDGVMGKLAAVRLNLYAMLYRANLIEDDAFSSQIEEIQSVEQEIRNIAHDLNANILSDNSDFIAIVKELFAKIENHSQIHFSLEVSDSVNWDLINHTIKINLYRVLQESLHNIEKYADAKHVAVAMSKTESGELEVTISDDGNGFNTKQKKNGIGIQNMKVRAAELGGRFEIWSEIKKGTKVSLIIPI
ncbi:tetratricopeptide repeat-containing sensor histidine kinase [Flavobacterium caeni]|uniref:tetratricopeptide repeat-containing sensor histidine kinase n=1 Tax=Flavobacterium caeni TaxID=490189 RepID=UPI0011131331|nr:tetratricopeptide repeat-containing sensor histidine kinase [Flavobacterium caeni]